VPMLWGTGSNFVPSWNDNANNAIASGSGHLLGFNEPDFPSQANLPADTAASAHIQYMNPFSSKARIGAPAITNSNIPGQSIDWLKAFLSACGGQCDLDFFPCHWYGPPDPSNLLDFVQSVYTVVQKPVWITEWQPISGSDDDINKFVTSVMQSLDSDPTYSYVERYSYFMVDTVDKIPQNLLASVGTPTTWGQTYAYS